MKKLPYFDEHNCYAEQKVAYNYLFSYCNCGIETLLKIFDGSKLEKMKLDREIIRNCIIKNFNNYINKKFIATSYKQIAENLPL